MIPLKTQGESWGNCMRSEVSVMLTVRGPLSSASFSMPVEPPEFPLSGAAMYFQFSANYIAIESWEMHLTLSLKKLFTFQSLTFYFTSSLLRAWMTHLEVKKYLNCLKYWCCKCHNLEEEAWKLAFKWCLQRFHVFCTEWDSLLEWNCDVGFRVPL